MCACLKAMVGRSRSRSPCRHLRLGDPLHVYSRSKDKWYSDGEVVETSPRQGVFVRFDRWCGTCKQQWVPPQEINDVLRRRALQPHVAPSSASNTAARLCISPSSASTTAPLLLPLVALRTAPASAPSSSLTIDPSTALPQHHQRPKQPQQEEPYPAELGDSLLEMWNSDIRCAPWWTPSLEARSTDSTEPPRMPHELPIPRRLQEMAHQYAQECLAAEQEELLEDAVQHERRQAHGFAAIDFRHLQAGDVSWLTLMDLLEQTVAPSGCDFYIGICVSPTLRWSRTTEYGHGHRWCSMKVLAAGSAREIRAAEDTLITTCESSAYVGQMRNIRRGGGGCNPASHLVWFLYVVYRSLETDGRPGPRQASRAPNLRDRCGG